MKNRKGQSIMIGAVLIAAIGVIVALSLLGGNGGIASGVGTLTNKGTVTDNLVTLAANGAYLDRPNCVNYQGDPTVINASDGETVNAANYTFTTRVSPTTSLKVLTIKTNAARYGSAVVNMSYTCLPQGYAEDSASRSMISLVILFAAVAIFVFVGVYAYKNLNGLT